MRIVSQHDVNGRLLYFKVINGKKVRISRDEALKARRTSGGRKSGNRRSSGRRVRQGAGDSVMTDIKKYLYAIALNTPYGESNNTEASKLIAHDLSTLQAPNPQNVKETLQATATDIPTMMEYMLGTTDDKRIARYEQHVNPVILVRNPNVVTSLRAICDGLQEFVNSTGL
jgi:hypothetical protein